MVSYVLCKFCVGTLSAWCVVRNLAFLLGSEWFLKRTSRFLLQRPPSSKACNVDMSEPVIAQYRNMLVSVMPGLRFILPTGSALDEESS